MDPRPPAERGVRRLAVHGLDYVMTVRDYRALTEGPFELYDFEVPFDISRAVKSDEELELVRESMAINEAGFWAVHEAYEPGRTQAELMAVAEEIFARLGTGRQTMDMVVWGGRRLDAGVPHPRPHRRSRPTTCCSTRSRSPAPEDTGSSSRGR